MDNNGDNLILGSKNHITYKENTTNFCFKLFNIIYADFIRSINKATLTLAQTSKWRRFSNNQNFSRSRLRCWARPEKTKSCINNSELMAERQAGTATGGPCVFTAESLFVSWTWGGEFSGSGGGGLIKV